VVLGHDAAIVAQRVSSQGTYHGQRPKKKSRAFRTERRGFEIQD